MAAALNAKLQWCRGSATVIRVRGVGGNEACRKEASWVPVDLRPKKRTYSIIALEKPKMET